MLKSRVVLFATALSLCCSFATAQAQKAAPDTVLLDVNKVLKEHTRLKQGLDQLKVDAEGYQKELQNRRADIQRQAQAAQEFKPGTPEYDRIEEATAQAMTDLKIEVARKQEDFKNRESKLFYTTYSEMQQVVSAFAQQHGIRMVKRFDSAPIDGNDRNSVMRGVTRDVIFQANLDITAHIIQQLNNPAVSNRPGAATTR